MKIGLLIPTRGDRELFLNQAKKLLAKQTRQPDAIEIIDFPGEPGVKDITKRYRIGFDLLFNKRKCDAVVLFEDDDYYAPEYVEYLISMWELYDKPELFGFNSTLYYNLLSKQYEIFYHPGRASACLTLVTPAILKMQFPPDDYSYLDMIIWDKKKNPCYSVSIDQPRLLHAGIKHGVGLVGGSGHNIVRNYYKKVDNPSFQYLRSVIDAEDIGFYTKLSNKLGKAR